jgi:hypothetical protein
MRRSIPLVIPCCVTVLVACGSPSSDDDDDTGSATGPTSADDDGSSTATTANPDDGPADASSSGNADDGSDDGTSGGPVDCDDPDLGPNEQMLVDMPADSWLEIQGTQFGTFCANPAYEYLHGVEGCGAVINDWCGAAWDPVHGQLLLWGGGHDGYWGNEVYGFDPKTMAWAVVKEPSPNITPDNQNMDPLADGTPVSRHTYGGLAYLPEDDLFWAWGGSMARSGNGTTLTWTLDLDSGVWTNLQPTGAPYLNATGPYSMGSAYDPATRTVFMQLNAGLSAYDVDANTWTPLLDGGVPPLWDDWTINSGSGVIDPVRRLFFAFGGGTSAPFVYDIDGAAHASEQWITTGAEAVVQAGAVGVDYDPVADEMVAWSGGTPCALDMTTKVWTCLNGTGAPPTQNANGTFGRWRYLAEYNVFMLVNQPDQNVYFYKHTADCGG